MTNRILVDKFGSTNYLKSGTALSKIVTDHSYVNSDGDEMSGDLNLGGHTISNVDTPNLSNDAANKSYVDQLIAVTNLQLTSISNRIVTMQESVISNLQQEINSLYTTKTYVDSLIQSTKNTLQSQIDSYPQRSIHTYRFSLARLLPFSTMRQLSNPNEQSYFIILGKRFKKEVGAWITDTKRIQISLQRNKLHINWSGARFPNGKLTGDGEVTLLKCSDSISIETLPIVNSDIGVAFSSI